MEEIWTFWVMLGRMQDGTLILRESKVFAEFEFRKLWKSVYILQSLKPLESLQIINT